MEILNKKISAKNLSNEILNLLDEQSINEIAREVGFIQRERKISGYKFLQLMLFDYFNAKESSLNDLSNKLSFNYGVSITKQGIDGHFTDNAVIFFKKVLEKVISKTQISESDSLLMSYDKVRIKDSTSFKLPDNMNDTYAGIGSCVNSIIRIQFEYDVKRAEIIDLSLHEFKDQDSNNADETKHNIRVNELIIRDLGYIKISVLRHIDNIGAFYLNRLHSGTNIYELINGKYVKICIFTLIKNMKKNGLDIIEKEVYIGRDEKFKTRIIFNLLPLKCYEQRLRDMNKKAKKKGVTISREHKEKMALNIFITNTDIPLKSIRKLYSIRWQIELIFKIWKSVLKIDNVKKMKIQRFESFLYSKLIWITINWKIIFNIILLYYKYYDIKLSIIKLFKTLKEQIHTFRDIIKKDNSLLCDFLEKIAVLAKSNHKSEIKKGGLWYFDILPLITVNNE
jgi:hypothetical protein